MYGYGDWQTWGGCSPEPSDYEIYREKVDEDEAAKLAELLDGYPTGIYELVVESEAWCQYIDDLIESRSEDV